MVSLNGMKIGQTEESRAKQVKDLIALHKSGDGNLELLQMIANAEHAFDCALGAVPACTCGSRDARDYIMRFQVAAH